MRQSTGLGRNALTVSLLLGGFTGLAGCGAKPHEINAGFGSMAYGRTTVSYGSWGDGTAILVWVDTEGQAGGGAMTSADGAHYRGRARSPDGRHLEWDCKSADGKTGPVTINGATYELANGAVFLVTTRGGNNDVRQIQRNLSGISVSRESLDGLVKLDADVAKFLAEADKS